MSFWKKFQIQCLLHESGTSSLTGASSLNIWPLYLNMDINSLTKLLKKAVELSFADVFCSHRVRSPCVDYCRKCWLYIPRSSHNVVNRSKVLSEVRNNEIVWKLQHFFFCSEVRNMTWFERCTIPFSALKLFCQQACKFQRQERLITRPGTVALCFVTSFSFRFQ